MCCPFPESGQCRTEPGRKSAIDSRVSVYRGCHPVSVWQLSYSHPEIQRHRMQAESQGKSKAADSSNGSTTMWKLQWLRQSTNRPCWVFYLFHGRSVSHRSTPQGVSVQWHADVSGNGPLPDRTGLPGSMQ